MAFGGVIAFLFADLVTFPLLVIYRRYYGLANAWRLFLVLWASASGAGLAIDGLFHLVHAIPDHRSLRILTGTFPLGATSRTQRASRPRPARGLATRPT